MRRSLSVAILSLLWLTPTPVLAQAAQETQPLSAAALQAAVNAAAQQAPANPTRQRSKGRLWGGVGMMGAGVVIAFYSQSCEATGALASDFVLNDGLLTTMLAPSGLGPLVKDGRCGIDFNIRGTIRGNFTGTVYADISGKYSDLADDPDLVAGLKAPPVFLDTD